MVEVFIDEGYYAYLTGRWFAEKDMLYLEIVEKSIMGTTLRKTFVHSDKVKEIQGEVV